MLEIFKLIIITYINIYAGSTWAVDTLQATLLVLSSMVLYLFITWFFQIRRAIKLEFNLINCKTGKRETQLHETSQEKDKTLKIGLKVERRYSIFSLFAKLFLSRNKLYIKVYSSSSDLILTPKNKKDFVEISESIDGFYIDLTDQIKNCLIIKAAFESEKIYEFVINTRRGIEVTPERKVLVLSNVLLGEKQVGFLFKTFFEVHDGTHTVEIFP